MLEAAFRFTSAYTTLMPTIKDIPLSIPESSLLPCSPTHTQVTPLSIKLATVVGMGLLIALIGMVSIHLVVANPQVRETLLQPRESVLKGSEPMALLVEHLATRRVKKIGAGLDVLDPHPHDPCGKRLLTSVTLDSPW